MITHTEQVGDRTQIKTWLLAILVIESAAVLGLRFLAGSSPWNSLLIVALLITFLVAIRLVASRFRFSLKFMLIAVNIIAVALVGPAFHVRRAGIEQTAVNAVTRGAGSVAFEPDFRRAPPDWIQRLVGPEYFNHAAFVQFGSAASDADLNHLSQLSRLTRLEFWQSNVTNAGLSRLKAVRNLRQLDFGGNPNIDATCFQHLLQIPKLESLHFDFPLTDQGLAYWPELALKLNGRESEVLNLTGLRISDAGLEHVSRMRSLTRLVLDGNARITDNGMQHLGKLRQLKVLVLARNQITDAGLAQLRGLDELEVLDLTGTQVTDRALDHIADLPSLRILQLSGSKVTGAGLAKLASLPMLRGLGLCDAAITNDHLRQFASLSNLAFLDLGGTRISDSGLEVLTEVAPQLVHLYASRTKVTDLGLASLTKMERLGVLDLSRTQVTDAGLHHIVSVPSIVDLRLAATAITDSGIQELAELSGLVYLDLQETKVTDRGLPQLAKLSNLRWVCVAGGGVTPAGIAKFELSPPRLIRVSDRVEWHVELAELTLP